MTPIPLSLYVHLPWCERKCPYCDFHSLPQRAPLPEEAYIDAVLRDLTGELPAVWGRRIESVFIGGGTPSLFSPEAIDRLLCGLRALLPLRPDCEITLEANPGSSDAGKFAALRQAGINRLSIGIQSFDDRALQALGRVHDRRQALAAVEAAQRAGFARINLDLMYGLPGQDHHAALADLDQALAFGCEHLSWYQLTLEPHTAFAACPPVLPADDDIAALHDTGCQRLAAHGLQRYEISAFARSDAECRHNLNYWTFGDYLGLGAGAHGKCTDLAQGGIVRRSKVRDPQRYQDAAGSAAAIDSERWLRADELPLEFAMNALRLCAGVPLALFSERTGLDPACLADGRQRALALGLLVDEAGRLQATPRGLDLLNDLVLLLTT